MRTRDYRDILGGGALICLGAFAAIHPLMTLRLGTVSHMGPGMFPMALGVILTGLGFAILLPALFRAGEAPVVSWRPMLLVFLSILAFALMVRPFGMVPSITVMTVIASQADSKLSPLGIAIMAALLSITAVLIFRVGLGLQIAIVAWPW